MFVVSTIDKFTGRLIVIYRKEITKISTEVVYHGAVCREEREYIVSSVASGVQVPFREIEMKIS